MWFKSYLSDRWQRVIVDGAYSDSTELSYGVPQGSCLGPLLFTIYASKLFQVVKTSLSIAHAYADDSQLYLSLKLDSGLSETEAITSMERCIKAALSLSVIISNLLSALLILPASVHVSMCRLKPRDHNIVACAPNRQHAQMIAP